MFSDEASMRMPADEAARSRLYGGIHWSFDNQAGLRSGAEVGEFVTANYLLPAASR